MNIINIGILAHVDAGKTTLTESLLYASGAISEPGSVEKGTTRTDTMLLERQRGITIQAAVTSFQWHRCKVNIVDTPGPTQLLWNTVRRGWRKITEPVFFHRAAAAGCAADPAIRRPDAFCGL